MKLFILQSAVYADAPYRVPFPFYLIQTDDGKNVLIDTGIAPHQLKSINVRGEPVIFQTEQEQTLNQLAALGLTPDDIDILISTHFDEDHCGAHPHFTKSQIIVQQSHYEVALSGREDRYEVCRKYWDAPGLHYHQINGDVDILPGIKVVVTDGHVPGHQSVLVRLPNTGAVLLAIDAIRNGDMLAPGIDPRTLSLFDTDGDKVVEGVRKLQAVMEDENVQLAVFGHDWPRWEPLRKAPEFYD